MIFVNYHRVWIAIVIAKCIYIIRQMKLKFLPIFVSFLFIISIRAIIIEWFYDKGQNFSVFIIR